MTDATDAAADFREAVDEVLDFAETVTPEQWEAVTSEEGWTVAATVHHAALGNATVAEWIESARAGEPIDLTREEQDADNAQHAEQFAKADRVATLELLRTVGADTEALIRSLSADDLASAVPFGPAGGAQVTVRQLTEGASGHLRSHLDHARAAAGDDADA